MGFRAWLTHLAVSKCLISVSKWPFFLRQMRQKREKMEKEWEEMEESENTLSLYLAKVLRQMRHSVSKNETF